MASAIVATGTPTGAVDGLRFMTNDEAQEDILRPLQNVAQSIDFVKAPLVDRRRVHHRLDRLPLGDGADA